METWIVNAHGMFESRNIGKCMRRYGNLGIQLKFRRTFVFVISNVCRLRIILTRNHIILEMLRFRNNFIFNYWIIQSDIFDLRIVIWKGQGRLSNKVVMTS